MIYPDLQTVRIYADIYIRISAYTALDYGADDMLDLHAALRGLYSFFLESGVLNSHGRYSIIALPCRKCPISKGGTTALIQHDETIQLGGNPLDALKKEMQECAPIYPELLVLTGGAIGHFNYNMIRLSEAIQDTRLPPLKLPLMQLAFVGELPVSDHKQHRLYVIVNMQTQNGCPDSAYDKVVQRIYELQAFLSHRKPYNGKPLTRRTAISSMNKQ